MKQQLKKALLGLLVTVFASNLNAQSVFKNEYGSIYAPNSYEVINTKTTVTRASDPYDEMERIMACPEGTVYGSSFINDGSYMTGNMAADLSRSDLACVFYQSIDGNQYKINGIRFFGIFKYYDDDSENWIYCNERGAIDEDGNMTKPVRFNISFNKKGSDGKPSDAIFSKEFDIIGTNTGLMVGDSDSGYGYIYSFDANLGEDVKLETGYVGITAVDMGDKPSCWFNIFTSATAQGTAMVSVNNGDDIEWMGSFAGPACMCLKGSGELSAQKAIKLERFLTPNSSADSKYEKVSVEISNVGGQAVSGVELELWKNGEFICKDRIDAIINPMSSDFNGNYKHIFSKTIDCSATGDNVITIKNAYKEDEQLCDQEMSKTLHIYAENEAVESNSKYQDMFFIKEVSVGSINNITEGNGYSDYTNMKTDIQPGANLPMTVLSDDDCNMYVWVDWNNNGNFCDNGEFIGNVDENGHIQISIPKGLDIKTGDKRMRIVSTGSWLTPVYSGNYDYGETEDYSLTVKRNPGQPEFTPDSDLIEITKEQSSSNLRLINNAESSLDATAVVNYILPGSPDGMNIVHSPIIIPDNMQGVMKTKTLIKTAEAPAKDTETQYVLGYDRGAVESIGLQGSSAIFAQLYTAQMLSNIKGMKISSVDVYLDALPKGASIQIYEEDKNTNLVGEVISETTFTPIGSSWNHVILEKPFEITGDKGLIVAVSLTGLIDGEYYIGTDNSNAVIGYGDLVGFNGFWWSMADLQINSNYCIRANVTGEKTPAISWLDIDKNKINVNNGSEGKINVKYNGIELSDYLYNAVIEFQTNDELRKTVRIPVYFINDVNTGIVSAKINDSEIVYNDNKIKIVSKKNIINISIYNINGELIENVTPENDETIISTTNYNKGIYIVSIMYTNGNSQGVKIPIIK